MSLSEPPAVAVVFVKFCAVALVAAVRAAVALLSSPVAAVTAPAAVEAAPEMTLRVEFMAELFASSEDTSCVTLTMSGGMG